MADKICSQRQRYCCITEQEICGLLRRAKQQIKMKKQHHTTLLDSAHSGFEYTPIIHIVSTINKGDEIASSIENVGYSNSQGIDKNNSAHTFYVIRWGITDGEVRRRYSDFDMLRKALQRQHPAAVIPPIPEKHRFTDYCMVMVQHKATSAANEAMVTEQRQRLLQRFLNRILDHPVLCASHIFHQFLSPGNTTWSDAISHEESLVVGGLQILQNLVSITSVLHHLSLGTATHTQTPLE
jgi:PX domain